MLSIFGSIDANRGDPQNGWDTDQFPNSVEQLTLVLLDVIRADSFTTCGFNIDAKIRRQSVDAVDLFHGHTGGIDTIARALLRAAAIVEAVLDGSCPKSGRSRHGSRLRRQLFLWHLSCVRPHEMAGDCG